MSGLGETFIGWLPALGGISGAAMLAYMVWMGYYARKKDRDVQELRRDLAEIRGLLLGRKR